MIRKIEDFLLAWKSLSEGTARALDALTDEALSQPVVAGGRTLGRIAWHVVTSVPEMAFRTGLRFEAPAEDAPIPSAAEMAATYRKLAEALAEAVRRDWTDETLLMEDDMYGEKWPRGRTLSVLMDHETHHRGQMTVLMRQAGLAVPGVCGPSKEEWAAFGMPAPQ
jgi:uncharacterized damage-inducible protein DinB